MLGGGRRGTVGMPSSERACSDSASRRRHCAARARGIHRVPRHYTRCVSLKSARALHSGGTIGPMRVRRTRARGIHRVQRLHRARAARARADRGASAQHDSGAHGGLRCPTASQTRASHARRPCPRARPGPEVGRFSPFLRFSGFCTFPVSALFAPFCVFSVFGRFHALLTQFRVKRGKFGTRKRRIV